MELTKEQKTYIMTKCIQENKSGNLYPMRLLEHLVCWLDTQDPDYMDSVVIQCHNANIPITGVILEQLALGARKRILREYSYGKKSKVNQDIPLNEAFWLIYSLTNFCHKTLKDASLLASWTLSVNHPKHSKKASVLDKGYPQWTKNNNEVMKIVKSQAPENWSTKEQEEFLSQFPKIEDIPQILKGIRRGSDPY
jgi:hypothetical protein